MFVFSNCEVADGFPVSRAELSGYNIPSDATHNHRKHVSVEADVGNNLASNRSQVFRLLQGCAGRKRNLVCLGTGDGTGEEKKAATDRRNSTAVEDWFE